MNRPALAVSLALWIAGGAAATQQTPPAPPPPAQFVTPSQLAAALDTLGSFDYQTRTDAARTIRRAPPELATAALVRTVAAHPESYVRYRALVLLSGFGEASAADTMRAVLTDPNDRLRAVAYAWFERHPDAGVLDALVSALSREQSEFVRPALTRALAAYRDAPRVKEALLPFVMRGEDFFRGAVIGALGDYGDGYALPAISDIARLDGPLQDDAVTALGRIGDKGALATLRDVQGAAPPDRQPTIAAALCLLGVDCAENLRAIRTLFDDAVKSEGRQTMVRSAAHALAVLATAGRADAFESLLDRGVAAVDPVRAAVALAAGGVALRRPAIVLDVLEKRADRAAAVELLRDAFDMFSEDFEEECFYVEMKRASTEAPADSPRRITADLLIRRLDFQP